MLAIKSSSKGILRALLAVLCLVQMGCSKKKTAAFVRPEPPESELKLAWNGEVYQVPPPALLPAEAYDTEPFGQWARTGDVRKLEYTDGQGRRYVAQGAFRWRNKAGQMFCYLRAVECHRADGTLICKTEFDPNGPPTSWEVYADDGVTKVARVINRTSGLPGTPFIQYVTLFDTEGKPQRQYQANSLGVVYLEWPLGPDGNISGGPLNGSAQLDETRG